MQFIIIDSFNFLFRAFYSLPKLTNDQGVVINALFGYIRMLLKYKTKFPDSYFIVVADTGTKNFRHDLDQNYKANRPEIDPMLAPQFDMAKAAVQAFNIPYFALPGFEADDVIATLKNKILNQSPDNSLIIVSSDKDLFQLIDERTTLLDPSKDSPIDSAAVLSKTNVMPVQIPDYLALIGDTADNIPGIAGIGPKTASNLLLLAPNLEELISNKAQLSEANPKMAKWLNVLDQQVLLYKKMTTLIYDVPIPDLLTNQELNTEGLKAFLRDQGFSAIISKVDELFPKKIEETKKVAPEKLYESIALESGVMFVLFGPEVHIADSKKQEAITSISEQRFVSLMQDPSLLKIVANYNQNISEIAALNLTAFHDIEIMAYCADMIPSKDFGDLCEKYDLPATVSSLVDLYKATCAKIKNEHVHFAYERLDRPMTEILNSMHKEGIAVDSKILEQLTREFSQQIKILEDKIYLAAGEPFNIGSPQQLAHILNEKMGINLSKKSRKTKNYSTSFEVLEELAGIHPVIDDILEWRRLSKMVNTYTVGMLKYINAGRVHTTYRVSSTNTGRISSQAPNMQNIPIKSPEGRRMRQAFVAKPEHMLVAADYSQIELRLLAHIAQEELMIEQINAGMDIHNLTASQIFHMPLEAVDKESRRRAKSINFGIIYGLTPFGLAKQLKIPQYEATAIIESYLNRYSGVAHYIENTKVFARANGYVKTISGRRCRTEHINSSDRNLRQFAERAAVNAPLQGSAADILKHALVTVDHYIKKHALNTKIVLQIHDEIILEVPNEELANICREIKEIMESVVALSIKLEANISVGSNLLDMSEYLSPSSGAQ